MKIKCFKCKCFKCGKEFEDINYGLGRLKAERLWCNDCVKFLWREYNNKIKNE